MFNSKNLFALASFVALALYPLVSGSYGIDLVTKIMIFAVFALSLELLVGTLPFGFLVSSVIERLL